MNEKRTVAYFSMEVGVEPAMPTYSGGLGVLAGDTIRSAADLKVPMVAVTLLHRKGYFHQRLDARGWQKEEPAEWIIEDFLKEMLPKTSVMIEGRTVQLRSWKYEVKGIGGFKVPVYFLDADLPENSEWDRTLTHFLYGGDSHYRLCQEVILGIGGVRMLRVLGYDCIERFHMNEGHSSLLTLELLEEEAKKAGRKRIHHEDIEKVREKCVFTTHTPVPAGHDQFPLDLVNRVLEYREVILEMRDVFCCEGLLNMTYLALNLSRYINGVAKRHGEVSRLMFAGYTVDAITNGVHAATWVSGPFQKLFNRYIPEWRQDNFSFRYALGIPKDEIWSAHQKVKRRLIDRVNRDTGREMDADVLTIGFARRATTYKRGDLFFTDIERLKNISSRAGSFQVIYAGKSHPQDRGGKELIKRIFQAQELLKPNIKLAYLENYDIDLGKMITAGVDLWLNTPQPPMEASGTSGMKAALNGVPSFSVLDGWWVEGHIEGVTGWSIGETRRDTEESNNWSKDASSIYNKLERIILPLFYRDRDRFVDVMRHCIALNGSFFNTHRMIQEYVLKAYFL
ncbi:MAG: alpha-glucan family phosphorylase [Deltaproteobacteria bacterium CG_4_8_14_3_um_filter_45_9]|nr:MAG: alpha-glucan family phosphorylase [Deltaproteobacteria bacterium CG03_land_8_20_14_0_80_45_14]PIX26431.1 MAG: alpha-glucan family phosphorylase [Deltaproteobacteria bacterium CG_4_8_14_3_um_filter_45_9]